MIWQSENAVIGGKHQNMLAEVDYRYIRENGISVARRISGGGTVFHDSGNVNFTMIKNVSAPSEISFKKFTHPIQEALCQLGINATFSGRNDLMIEGKKISGNAEHVFKNRVLHHGTLLFNSDLIRLGKALRVISGKYEGKAVLSNRSEVTNISGYLHKSISVNDFIQHLLFFNLKQSGGSLYSLSEFEKEIIGKLSAEKFQTWEWQYGYSPAYTFTHSSKIGAFLLNVRLETEKGVIQRAFLSGDLYTEEEKTRLSKQLLHQPHRYESIEKAFLNAQINIDPDVLYGFF